MTVAHLNCHSITKAKKFLIFTKHLPLHLCVAASNFSLSPFSSEMLERKALSSSVNKQEEMLLLKSALFKSKLIIMAHCC